MKRSLTTSPSPSRAPRHLARRDGTLGCFVLASVLLVLLVGCADRPRPNANQRDEDARPPIPSSADIIVPRGTILRCALAQPLSTFGNRVGDRVQLVVMEQIVLDGHTIFVQGSAIEARVTHVQPARTATAEAQLGFQVVAVETPTGAQLGCVAEPTLFRGRPGFANSRPQVADGSLWLPLEGRDLEVPAGQIVDIQVSSPLHAQVPINEAI